MLSLSIRSMLRLDAWFDNKYIQCMFIIHFFHFFTWESYQNYYYYISIHSTHEYTYNDVASKNI